MKDQVTVLMEAVRLACFELQKLRDGEQNLEAAVDAIESTLRDPRVTLEVYNLEPFVESPQLAPLLH